VQAAVASAETAGASISQAQSYPMQPPVSSSAFQAPYADARVRGRVSVPKNALYATGKSPFLALLLSFLIPGVGQFYNGDAKRGLPMFLVGIFGYALVLLPMLGLFLVFGIHIWSMVNAYTVASGKTPLG
jgi:TM2 domain-containing membrane protein YozV